MFHNNLTNRSQSSQLFKVTSRFNSAVRYIWSKHNLITGRVSTVVPSLFTGSPLCCRLARVATVQLVFTPTVHTNPSRLGITSTILPSGHLPLGNDYSANKTKSPTAKFLLGMFHFFLSNKVGRYSLVQLRQNKSTNIGLASRRVCSWGHLCKIFLVVSLDRDADATNA